MVCLPFPTHPLAAWVMLAVNQDGETALLVACRRGKLDVVKWLAEEAGSKVESERDKVGTEVADGLGMLLNKYLVGDWTGWTHSSATSVLGRSLGGREVAYEGVELWRSG
jgi:hypothetical protein